jgi:hypothetical protein
MKETTFGAEAWMGAQYQNKSYKKSVRGCELGSSVSEQAPLASSCEGHNKFLSCAKHRHSTRSDIQLDLNAGKTKCMFMSRYQNTVQHQITEVANDGNGAG